MKKNLIRNLLAIGAVLLLCVIINFIPTWSLKTRNMNTLPGNWVTVYYETEKAVAEDVLALADSEAAEVVKALGLTGEQKADIYIYDSQQTMQTKKYGLIAPLMSLDWYIGDNIGTDVILTSPANPGREHDYASVKEAVVHEMVHAYISIINPRIRLWLTEGMALYLANGRPFYREYLDYIEIPTLADIRTRNPVKFSKMGGYTLSNTYIEYLDSAYGWSKVYELIRTQDYIGVFGKSEEEIYQEWTEYIKNYRQ